VAVQKIWQNKPDLKPSYPVIEPVNGWFKPAFTPAQMLELGVFGMNYFANASETDFLGLDPETEKLAREQNRRPKYLAQMNYFGVKAGLDFAWWTAKGLIFEEDPLGWFHWYCRYYAGRRHPRDLHQISRHQNFNRWLVNGQNQRVNTGSVSPVVLQSLLHWSWDPGACWVESE
jgi:hypothetical protein